MFYERDLVLEDEISSPKTRSPRTIFHLDVRQDLVVSFLLGKSPASVY